MVRSVCKSRGVNFPDRLIAARLAAAPGFRHAIPVMPRTPAASAGAAGQPDPPKPEVAPHGDRTLPAVSTHTFASPGHDSLPRAVVSLYTRPGRQLAPISWPQWDRRQRTPGRPDALV